MIKKITLTVLLAFIAANLCLAAKVQPSSKPQIIDTCGEAVLLEISEQKVLILSGNHYQLGYQQGKLLKDETRKLVSSILDIVQVAQNSGLKGFSHGSINEAYERTKDFIDKRYHDEMRGLADGAQIPLADVQLANIFPELFHCSGFALFGSATKDGTLLHGRILDYMTEVGLQDYAVVTISSPVGYNSFVNVGYAGFIGSVTGMNDKQVAIGEMGGGGEGDWDGMPMSFLIRKALEEAVTLDKAVSIFQTTPRTCEYYYMISDAKIPDARGLACTPEKFEVVLPGTFHKLLPNPVDDTVLLSSSDRYKNLAKLVKTKAGSIDTDYALTLMDKPVAMDSCLHRVLFEPKGQNIWVSNAVSPTKTTEYAAFHQPYYHYNITELLEFAKSQGLNNDLLPSKPQKEDKQIANTQLKQQITEIKGIVGKDIQRPIPASDSPAQQKLLNKFDAAQNEFEYLMTPITSTNKYNIYEVSFPTAYDSGTPENNIIYCEYYEVKDTQKAPAVIVLDIMDGSMIISRIIANALANKNINACIMTLPYYGKRMPENSERYKFFKGNVEFFVKSVEQGVIDIRTTARWLSSLDNVDNDKIGISGASLGGFIGALSAGVDGNFYKAAFIASGADLTTVLTTDAKEVRRIKETLEKNNITKQQLSEMIASIEPLTYADRLKNTDILMVNGNNDEVVPLECAQKFADTCNAKIILHPADHYSMTKYILPIIGDVGNHFDE